MKDAAKGLLFLLALSLGGCYSPNDPFFLGGEQEVEIINDTDDVIAVYYPYRISAWEGEDNCYEYDELTYGWYDGDCHCNCAGEIGDVYEAVAYAETGESLFIYVETDYWDGSVDVVYQGKVRSFDVDIDLLEEDEIRVRASDFISSESLEAIGFIGMTK